jgi:hypothetical protein
MTDKKDEPGKTTPRPGEAGGGKRPYATIEGTATEVGAKQPAQGQAAGKEPKQGQGGAARPASAGRTQQPPPRPTPAAPTAWERVAARAGAAARLARSNAFLSHVAAGVAGALVVLMVSYVAGPGSVAPSELGSLAKRLDAAEDALGLRAGAGATLRARLEAVEAQAARLDEATDNLTTLEDAQTKLGTETKALANRLDAREAAARDLGARLAKLENALTALPPGEVTDAVRASMARVERDLSALRSEGTRLGSRLDTLRGDVDERLAAAAKAADVKAIADRVAALEQRLQGFQRSEGERTANTARIVLSLELANLKRAMDRGDRYNNELAAVKRAGGDKLALGALERHMHDGVPTVTELSQSFRKVSNAMLDAEAEPADATLLQRLISGARSIVRVRKAGHDPDDASTEAVIARMEAALKDGRLGDVVEHGKKLPPKAALAGEEWLKKVEARYSVDRALADVEAALKSSLGAGTPAGTETRR